MYHDHHFHPFGYASVVNGLDLMEAQSLDQVMGLVAARAGIVEGPIIGQRLNDEGLAELRLPTASELDDIVGERPVLLYRYCGHIAVANSAALALARVDGETPDPKGGSYDRDLARNPNGIMRETAIEKVASALAPLAPTLTDAAILDALAGLAGYEIGSITGIVSAGNPVWCGVGDEVGTLARIAADLPIDVDALVIASSPATLASARDTLNRAGGRVRFLGWKDFSDGSLGGHTAAMREPYADRPETRGTDRLERSRALDMARASLALGGVVAIHAIGDRANDQVLDLFEALIEEGADPSSLRLEHASILTPHAVERAARLGVVVSVQPAFLASEQNWLHKRLGPDRMRNAYPFRSLIDAGVRVLGGSDSPVETPDPAIGINAAVDRHGINPDEALTEAQAAALFARLDS